MSNFVFEKIESIQGHVLSFQKVIIDGRCLYDDFCMEIDKTSLRKEYRQILTRMNLMANGQKLPFPQKFNTIKGLHGGCEFKSKHLRIYAIREDPNVYIVLGGKKTTQDNDIKGLKRIAKELRKSMQI